MCFQELSKENSILTLDCDVLVQDTILESLAHFCVCKCLVERGTTKKEEMSVSSTIRR